MSALRLSGSVAAAPARQAAARPQRNVVPQAVRDVFMPALSSTMTEVRARQRGEHDQRGTKEGSFDRKRGQKNARPRQRPHPGTHIPCGFLPRTR